MLRPWRAFDAAIPGTSRWGSSTTAVVAVLDARFVAAARRWPRLYRIVHDRMADQLDRAAVRAAIVGPPRVEQRVLGLFWQLAERWGKVRPDGVLPDLRPAGQVQTAGLPSRRGDPGQREAARWTSRREASAAD